MTPKRSRLIDPDARVYPIEAAEIVGVSFPRLSGFVRFEGFPPPVDGMYHLRDFLAAYLAFMADRSFSDAIDDGIRRRRIWRRVSPQECEQELSGVSIGDLDLPEIQT